MSNFYARFKDRTGYVLVFLNEEERDNWLHLRGKYDFRLSEKFKYIIPDDEELRKHELHRVPLTEKQAKYIIKKYELEEMKDWDLLGNEFITYDNDDLIQYL